MPLIEHPFLETPAAMKRHHLTSDQFTALRSQLSERAASLRGELAEALHAPHARDALGLPNRREETDDDAVADLETGLDVAAVERDAAELNQVMEALKRLERGTYGVCVDCGDDIPWPRLHAQPHAKRCLSCEASAERRKPRPTPGL